MYNTPILTPEDRVEQPIDIPDGYSGVYGITANDLICDAKSDYWIGNTTPCNIYKGPFPNKEEIIMTCSRESTTGVYSSIDELVFSHKGIVQAELRCEKEDILEKRITLSLRSQQKELGVVYRHHDISMIDYYPFFRLASVPEGCCYKTMGWIFMFSLLIGIWSIIYLLIERSITMLLITIIPVGICSAYCSYLTYCCYCCKCCMKNGVRRLHEYNVRDMKTDKLVVKVYTLRINNLGDSYGREFSCRTKMTRSQLIGLFSLVMLSGRVIPGEPPRSYD